MRTPPPRVRYAVALTLATGLLAACANDTTDISEPAADESAAAIEPSDPIVAELEEERRADDAAVYEISLTAAPTTIDLGDQVVDTWAFNDTVPAPEIRLQAGDVLRAEVRNDLPEPLSIHWHGIDLRNDMDGVPAVTQEPIEPGERFTYEFAVPDAGTFFYHSHVGTQLDRGLYGPLIVDERGDRADPGTVLADHDITLLVDDWIDGTGRTPDDVLDDLRSTGGGHAMHDMDDMDDMDDMNGMAMGPTGDRPLGPDTSDVDYPLFVINGRSPSDPAEFDVLAGGKVRLRLVNAGADTPFRVAVGGSSMTVIATDGLAVDPVETSSLLIGMGERYDVLVTVPDTPVTPIVAAAEGGDGAAVAILRSATGDLPPEALRPPELDTTPLTYADLRASAEVALPDSDPDRTRVIRLTGGMNDYEWGIDTTDRGSTIPVRAGERVRLVIRNDTMMWHPIHLHGHRFQVVTDDGGVGPRKDTVSIPPMSSVTVDIDADNPGQWLLHCHNIYHAEAGMHTMLSYVA